MHKHPIYDTDIHFTIDTATREISCANKSDLILIQGDHNSQRISIDVPRYIDGHDTSLCNRVRLHYINIDQMSKEQSADIAQLDDIQVCPDDENVVVCTWLISKNATKYVGLLNFAIRFECVVNDIVEYSWGTKLRRGIIISDSIDNSDIVFDEYEDILESWYQNTVANIKNHGQNILDSIPEDYTELTQHVTNLEQEIECTNENLESHIELAFERYVEHEEDIRNLDVKLSDRINRNDKRITNLEKGLPDENFTVDSTTAYSKSVPENALPYAEVTEIGGMTRKCTNLLDMRVLDDKTLNGVTFTKNSNGTYTANGTATGRIQVSLCFAKIGNFQTAVLSGGSANVKITVNGFLNDVFVKNLVSVTNSTEKLPQNVSYDKVEMLLLVTDGTTLSNETFFGMFNSGSEPLPYEPYFEGLRSAPVTEVESVGVNLWSGEISRQTTPTTYTFENGTMTLLRNGGAVQCGIWSKIKYKSGSYIVTFKGENISGGNLIFASTTISGDNYPKVILKTWFSDGESSLAFTLIEDSYLGFFTDVDGQKLIVRDIMLNKGSEPLPYTPYQRNTLPIPEAVRVKNFINDQVYDRIRYKEDGSGEREIQCGEDDMGTLNWSYDSNRFGADITSMAAPKSIADRLTGFMCSEYRPNSVYDATQLDNKGMLRVNKRIYLRDDDYTDVATFKVAMSGVKLLYELETSIITNISDLLPDDNYIGVEGGGTVTMVNEFGYDVPSTVVYQIDTESEVVAE